jgi:mono/diheme cytochrome c family protein
MMKASNFFPLILLMAMGSPAQDAKPRNPPAKPHAVHGAERDGQQVFEQNCSRCHAAPQGFPSHISGTIVLHMRVRAGISAQDEKALLRFFNP